LQHRGVELLKDVDAILVPGGFGERGSEGKIQAVHYARQAKIPYLGICYGLQMAIVDIARDKLGFKDANSTEITPKTPHPVIALVTEWTHQGGKEYRDQQSDKGGTMRLGGQVCVLNKKSLAYQLYGKEEIIERHRHRYEVNGNYVKDLESVGVRIGGYSRDGQLVEMIELPTHPWFVACQFHPEFNSSPREGHPLFIGFINAAKAYHQASRQQSKKKMMDEVE